MDILFELIFEIVLEGSLELGTSKKIPMLLRVLALLILLVIYVGMIGIFAMVGLDCLESDKTFAAILIFIFDAVFAVLAVRMVWKKYKEKRNNG